MIVSEIAGTTRDSVDVRFELDGKAFVAIDTPGVRKKKSLANDIEFYGLIRAQKSIRRADVVLMFFDATQTISQVDKKLMEEIQDHSKPCIFVINKWDLGLEKAMSVERWSKYLETSFKSMRHVPMAFITAKDSQNIKQLINLAQSIFKQARERVSTGLLNRVLAEAVKANPPHIAKNRTPKLFFATQVATEPPTIVVKVNNPELFSPAWERYLLASSARACRSRSPDPVVLPRENERRRRNVAEFARIPPSGLCPDRHLEPREPVRKNSENIVRRAATI